MDTLLILTVLPWLFLCIGWCWDAAGPSLTHTLPLGWNGYNRPGFPNPAAGLAFQGEEIWVPVPSHPPLQEPLPWRGGGGRGWAVCRPLLQGLTSSPRPGPCECLFCSSASLAHPVPVLWHCLAS